MDAETTFNGSQNRNAVLGLSGRCRRQAFFPGFFRTGIIYVFIKKAVREKGLGKSVKDRFVLSRCMLLIFQENLLESVIISSF